MSPTLGLLERRCVVSRGSERWRDELAVISVVRLQPWEFSVQHVDDSGSDEPLETCGGCGEEPEDCTCGACWGDDDFDRDELGDDPEED